MKVTIAKSELAGALVALGKLIIRNATNEIFKSVLIEASATTVCLTTCDLAEMFSVELPAELSGSDSDAAFSCSVPYMELRALVKPGKGSVVLEYTDDRLFLSEDVRGGQRVTGITTSRLEWPEFESGKPTSQTVLPENFVALLASAAPIIDRTADREILRGINLSKDGIAVTDGKHLLNIPVPLEIDSMTIPFPLCLLAAAPYGEGTLKVRQDSKTKRRTFEFAIANVVWRGCAVHGNYPNWRQVVPDRESAKYAVNIDPDEVAEFVAFLKSIPKQPPFDVMTLLKNDDALRVASATLDDFTQSFRATFSGDCPRILPSLGKPMLLRLLELGHKTITCHGGTAPVVASGGTGLYVAMPLREGGQPESHQQPAPQPAPSPIPAEIPTPEPTPTPKEAKPMETKPEMQETAAVETVNPLDELSVTIEAFRVRLKTMLDDSIALGRKVREVALTNKQYEREAVQARRTIEKIRLVSGF